MKRIEFTHDEKYFPEISKLIDFYDTKTTCRSSGRLVGDLGKTTINADFDTLIKIVYDLGKLKINVNFIIIKSPITT